MFTGIIEATAGVMEKSDMGFLIERPKKFDDIRIGSSICVSGCCLSVVEFDDEIMRFEIMRETWDRTKLGLIGKGGSVNLERALKANGRLEGHIVQGHVDCVGRIRAVDKTGGVCTVAYPKSLRGLIVEKGSIAVDGVSLTVASMRDNGFSVALIPHTLKSTTLGFLAEGDDVNLEADIIGRYLLARGLGKG